MSKKQKGRSKQSSAKYSKSKINQTTQRTSIWLLSPIIFILSVLPFIIKLKEYNTNLSKFSWFTSFDQYTDIFLYYKQSFFLIAVLIMAVIVLFKAYTDRKNIENTHILIPLAIYATLAFLSSVFSKYRSFSFRGIYSHFESVFVLLGYCLIVYYCLQIIKSEQDVRLIVNCFVVSVIVMSLLGLTQYFGQDFFSTTLGRKLILPRANWNALDTLQFN
ncbi:MAG: hypothetical protein GX818_01255, partial [Tissierellia bacterium]|nr:hypothetical protein [Tissierellia bacterium]